MRREGRDLTIVATGVMVARALEAAEKLAGEGVEAEVIDPRSLRPLDVTAIAESVKKTSRLICVYEGVKAYGVGAEISAAIVESDAFDYLDAPVMRLGGADAPIPYSPVLERAAAPQVGGYFRRGAEARAGLTMPVEVILPRVDMDMTEAKFAQWFAARGGERRQGPAAV